MESENMTSYHTANDLGVMVHNVSRERDVAPRPTRPCGGAARPSAKEPETLASSADAHTR